MQEFEKPSSTVKYGPPDVHINMQNGFVSNQQFLQALLGRKLIEGCSFSVERT